MKCRFAIGACACLVVLAGAVFGTELLRPKAEFVVSDNQGHTWHMKMSFTGKVQVFAPDGHQVGTCSNANVIPSLLHPAASTTGPDGKSQLMLDIEPIVSMNQQ